MESGLVEASPSSYLNPHLWEYLLIARPEKNVYDKIMEEKHAFSELYQYPFAVQTKPHITVANYLGTQYMEETIMRWIHRICSRQKSFTVTINNYSGFPSHTIYLRVQDPQPFKQLVELLHPIGQYVCSNGCPQVRFITRPHVTIAGGLPAELYQKAMMDYSQKIFHESFQLNELGLLKRKHQFDKCQQLTVFRFYPPDTNNPG